MGADSKYVLRVDEPQHWSCHPPPPPPPSSAAGTRQFLVCCLLDSRARSNPLSLLRRAARWTETESTNQGLELQDAKDASLGRRKHLAELTKEFRKK